MKKILMTTLVVAGLLSLPSQGQTVTRDDLRRTVEHMRQLARELQGELDAATTARTALSTQLGQAEASLAATQARADALQAQIDEQTREQEERLAQARAATAQAEKARDQARADLAHVLRRYHFLKLLGAGLCAGLVFLLVWRFSPPVAGPWALAIYLVPPAAAFAAFCVLL